MSPTPMCLCFLLRRAEQGTLQVLLGPKKCGFGAGKVVGLGGHVEAEESARAAVQEVFEECGLTVAAEALQERARVIFRFPSRPSWDQEVRVFVAEGWSGEPGEPGEISPLWFGVDALPLDRMWDDARFWLPAGLRGERLEAHICFHDDCRTVAHARVGRLS